MIQQQPKVSNNDQPTVAIITVNYYEKLAVDAMMTNKVTFVRHKPEGNKKKNLFFPQNTVLSFKISFFIHKNKHTHIY